MWSANWDYSTPGQVNPLWESVTLSPSKQPTSNRGGITMLRNFKGKTAVITGGASGIGLAYARKCSELGMNLVLADIEANALQKAVAWFEERQTPVIGVITDTMRKASIETLFKDATARFGNIHLLFNNAGVVNGGAPVPMWEIPDVDWDWVLGVNLHGVRWGIQKFVPHMIAHGEPGHVVNTASIAAFIPGGGPYGVSKYGVILMSEGLSHGLKARNSRVGASVLCPGWVNTKIAEAERNRPGTLANQNNPHGTGLPIGTALSEGKSPDDIANIVFDAIESDRFYVLPHAGWDDVVTGHAAAIVAREAAFVLDTQAILARRSKGIDV
ncbi:MAG: SDR family NAD(P)-dependent oxidoreductase [Gammaproteobacteria bacterium]|nr:SDR family NAD(P)-dependent oxidoreductase [Gammaproteobacteria bacterium]